MFSSALISQAEAASGNFLLSNKQFWNRVCAIDISSCICFARAAVAWKPCTHGRPGMGHRLPESHHLWTFQPAAVLPVRLSSKCLNLGQRQGRLQRRLKRRSALRAKSQRNMT